MTVDRLARHARLYGTEGVFPAACDTLEESELPRLAAILRRHGWRPTKAEQARIEAAQLKALPPIVERSATSGLSLSLDPVLTVTDGEFDLDAGMAQNGRERAATCAVCGSPFRAVRSTASYCGPKCRKRASRGSTR